MSNDVHQGQLWYVQSQFLAERGISSDKRRVVVESGEVIYIQNPYAWHFRTLSGDYLVAPENIITDNCKLLGEVFSNVKFQASMPPLAYILHYHLYDEADRSLNIDMRCSQQYKDLIYETYKGAYEREIKLWDKQRDMNL